VLYIRIKMVAAPPVPREHTRAFLECLEPRIAPAATFNIGDPAASFPDLGFVVSGYSDRAVFGSAHEAPFSGPAIFGSGDTNHYFMTLPQGSKVNLISAFSRTDGFVDVTGGLVYAFFHDKNSDKVVTANELTGLAVSAGARLRLEGSVDGDIITNVNLRTKVISSDSLISTQQNIASLTVGGNVGKIVAGGDIANVSVSKVSILQSGNDSKPLVYSFGGTGSSAGQGVLAPFAPAPGRVGGSLLNISVGEADEIRAGIGGVGGKGGDVRGLTVFADPDGIKIFGGKGGDSGRTGGVGGILTQVVVRGALDSDPGKTIHIAGGHGGAGSVGGRGGDASQVWIGYQSVGGPESSAVLKSSILVEGGQGGAGVRAGAGGNLTGAFVVAAPPDDPGKPHEIEVRGGSGGNLIGRGAAGAGGNLTTFTIKNLDDVGPRPEASAVLIAGGRASLVSSVPGAELSRGAAGGSVSNPVARPAESWLVGQNFKVDGGAGVLGGAGGSVRNLYFQNGAETLDLRYYLRSLQVSGGLGGSSPVANGGVGGSVDGVYVPNAIFKTLSIEGGRGGHSDARVGGMGGGVSNVQIFDGEVPTLVPPQLVNAIFRAGDGGDGRTGGGRGGSLTSVSLFSDFAQFQGRAGDGGDVNRGGVARGAGGLGGSISGLAFLSADALDAFATAQTALIQAGSGGDGRLNGAGAAGGGITNVSVETPGLITVKAGDGGRTGNGGVSGAGGSVGGNVVTQGLGLVSGAGSVEVLAGNGGKALVAGNTVGRGGLGGSVTNVVAWAADNITIRAGAGGDGGVGAGGSLNRIGFYGDQGVDSLVRGKVILAAGDGATPATGRQAGGVGGSITNVAGSGSSSAQIIGHLIDIRAGRGGGQPGGPIGAVGGAGGSVSGVTIYDTDVSMVVLAGRGGDGISRGGIGGSVANVAFNSTSGAFLLAVAAGDGGGVTNLRAAGAAGGSINGVNASHDIGIRQGVVYGFATDGTKMGGLFAGAAGVKANEQASASNPRLAGKVTNVTAAAISSIVAGRGDSPLLVNTIDQVKLNGSKFATVLPNGNIPDYGTLNIVGAKERGGIVASGPRADAFRTDLANYTASGATIDGWVYGVQKPLDGLVAALTITNNTNFMPLVTLTAELPPRANLPIVYRLAVPDLPRA